MSKLIRVLCSGFGAAGATFILQVLLSHKLSMQDFGVYVAANSSLTMIGPFAGMGIGGLFLRNVCISEIEKDRYLIMALKCILTNIVIAIIVGNIIFFYTGLNFIQSLCLTSFYLPAAIQYLVISYGQVSENFTKVSIAQIINPMLRLIAVLFLFLISPNLTNTVILLLLANIVSFAILLNLIDLKKALKKISLEQSRKLLFSFYKESFFYSFNGSINVIQIQFSIFIAIHLFGSVASAIYSSAITLITACYILPNLIFGTYLLPKYHKLEKDALKNISQFYAIAAFLLGLIFVIIIYTLSGIVIQSLYPASFKNSSILLKILAVSLPFRFYSTAIGAALLNEKCIKNKVTASFLSLVFQICLIFFLQGIGEKSLSISFVLSEVFTAIVYTIIFLKYFNNKNSI
ncbi:oligosaccharide flippase family protein [Flavobacterium sp. GN10]|uniref:Oligosaccharide flippase family protein n=1 Tax=Flavobacterium tagetis TaxID=2801336 RepID=A0ABS1KJA7_9FLAO|nr:oligosaccharide flippase family protein [Flavobacterium tagetis]MBL0739317.1 oligosaccharide flippase family protein [Flavobacterium tagetis]